MKNLKVAVLDVVSRVQGEKVDAVTLTEMLQVALVDKREFKIVERSLLESIIKEQEFQLSGITEDQAVHPLRHSCTPLECRLSGGARSPPELALLSALNPEIQPMRYRMGSQK